MDTSRECGALITVATPFYGYGGQVHRFFKGDSQLNWTEGPNGATKVTEIVSTLPAGYELLFLDGPTFDANQAGFAQDPEGYDLTSYPSMDATTAGQRADPYNPIPGAPTSAPGDVRYLSSFGFDWTLLADGNTASHLVAQPLNAAVAGNFWNIRGVQLKSGKIVQGTVVAQKWQLVPPAFDPDADPDPLTDNLGPGDGTLPAWSTRLLGNPNVITIEGDIEHMDMMNEAAVQVEIANLLNLVPHALRRMHATAKTVKMKTASRASLNELLERLRAVAAVEGLEPQQRKDAVRDVLREFSPDGLQEFLGRAYLDALKSPSQIAGRRDRGGKTKEPKRRPEPSREPRSPPLALGYCRPAPVAGSPDKA